MVADKMSAKAPTTSPVNAPKPTSWLRCRLQWDGLCQAGEGFDAEQVGIHLRLLRQKLVKGLHSVCSRQDALSTAHVALWRLVGFSLASRSSVTTPAPRMAQAGILLPPSRNPCADRANRRPFFQARPLTKTLASPANALCVPS